MNNVPLRKIIISSKLIKTNNQKIFEMKVLTEVFGNIAFKMQKFKLHI